MPKKPLAMKTTIKSQDVFFPTACLAAIGLSLLSQTARMGLTPWAEGLIGLGHAHELLFGFVLALICGYTLGKIPFIKMWLMVLVWLAARIAFLIWPGSVIAEGFNIVFALWVVRHIAPRYLVAKKWRNKIIAPLLVALFCFPLGWFLLSLLNWPLTPQAFMQSLLILLIMLMSFISGRMLAPAFAGDLQQQNYILKARVQPRIEAGILIIPPLASMLLFQSMTQTVSALLLVMLAGLLMVRVLRWQFWRCWRRSDLMGLTLGYFWLMSGSLLLAYSLAFGGYHPGFIHVITVGAIGTLSAMVILKYLMPKRHFPALVFYPPMILILTAVITRLLADYSTARTHWLVLSVSAWSLAYSWILIQWIRTRITAIQPT
ncbi:NnrS family protein [Marinicella gelatinilytica]|uniref:NnrS family protein n=1 Tax=Marinicella gelatinilytica TaxID=2996017 RepID=UPI0022608D3C|nr:NnrS family protein [Marinicella gelatinilytica]MCX7544860.1 NnrS family protein [Marinicella gelatinilytica]